LIVALVELIALTIDFIPFTRAHQPGHAKLRTRWFVYVIGMWAFAYWPARLELSTLGEPARLIEMVSVVVATTVAIEVFGRLRSRRWPIQTREELDENVSAAVLDISGIIRTARTTR
jgi:hypothetical protein